MTLSSMERAPLGLADEQCVVCQELDRTSDTRSVRARRFVSTPSATTCGRRNVLRPALPDVGRILSGVRRLRSYSDTMTRLVAQSKALCHDNRKLLTDTRLLMARSRRFLNPAFEISGGSSGDDLRQTVHDRLVSGALFPAPQKMWAGQGTGRICIVCDAAITASEVEHAIIDGPATVWAHSACYQIWLRESTAYERANVMDGTD